ncbi:MAG: 30S ribosomal protein S9 [Candidatus Liptonbacteria bacterium]|nr:30S ribosomal protein S9 [Candidatus Liptonbacteria bacterium]
MAIAKDKKEIAPKATAYPARARTQERYIEAVGRRKTAAARVRLWKRAGEIKVNGKSYNEYFKTLRQRKAALAPLLEVGMEKDVAVEGRIKGGGLEAQAEAFRHGIARALTRMDGGLKPKLRRAGFMTRDPRMVERKKYGLKKARRAPQWSKR